MSIKSSIKTFLGKLKKQPVISSIVKSQTPEEFAKEIIDEKIVLLKSSATTSENNFVVFPKVCQQVNVVILCIHNGYYPRFIIREHDHGIDLYERVDIRGKDRVAYPANPWKFSGKVELLSYVTSRHGISIQF